MYIDDHSLSEEQRMMRDTCRAFVDEHVIPFIRQDWQREWIMSPEDRLPALVERVGDADADRRERRPRRF